MTARRVAAVAAALVVLCYARDATAEPLRTLSPATCQTEGGSTFTIAPSVILERAEYDRLNVEIVRLQDTETRRTAENNAPRRSRWILAAVFVAGIGAGWYASR